MPKTLFSLLFAFIFIFIIAACGAMNEIPKNMPNPTIEIPAIEEPAFEEKMPGKIAVITDSTFTNKRNCLFTSY